MVQHHPFRRRLRSRFILGLVLACGLLFLSKNIGARYALWQHQRIWNQHAIPNYRYALYVGSMGSPDLNEDVRIEVHANRPTVVTAVDSSRPFTSPQDARPHPMDRLFQVIQDAVNYRADHVRVEYHPDLGYPSAIVIDPSAAQVDDEIHYRIDDFEVLP